MISYVIVGLGAFLGGALRHGVNVSAARLLGLGFPYGTLIVNVVGSFVMGVLAATFAHVGTVSQHWRLFLTTGILGGFTTFSTFSLDVALLVERGDFKATALYLLGSFGLSIGGLFLGLWLVRSAVP